MIYDYFRYRETYWRTLVYWGIYIYIYIYSSVYPTDKHRTYTFLQSLESKRVTTLRYMYIDIQRPWTELCGPFKTTRVRSKARFETCAIFHHPVYYSFQYRSHIHVRLISINIHLSPVGCGTMLSDFIHATFYFRFQQIFLSCLKSKRHCSKSILPYTTRPTLHENRTNIWKNALSKHHVKSQNYKNVYPCNSPGVFIRVPAQIQSDRKTQVQDHVALSVNDILSRVFLDSFCKHRLDIEYPWLSMQFRTCISGHLRI